MNLTVTAVPSGNKTFGQNEKKDARLTRMRGFWKDSTNAVFYLLGMLLALTVDGKKTIAEVIATGGEVTLDSLTLPSGVVLPINPPQVLSLATCADKVKGWGCPACHSAHGSGVYPSRDVDQDLLARTKWFYNPVTRRIMTVSDTCWKEYVKDLGAASRFQDSAKLKPAATPSK